MRHTVSLRDGRVWRGPVADHFVVGLVIAFGDGGIDVIANGVDLFVQLGFLPISRVLETLLLPIEIGLLFEERCRVFLGLVEEWSGLSSE